MTLQHNSRGKAFWRLNDLNYSSADCREREGGRERGSEREEEGDQKERKLLKES